MELITRFFEHILSRIWTLIRWIGFALYTGIVLGIVSSAFSYCLRTGIAARNENPQLIILLPVGGLLIAGFYKLLDYSKDGGTNLVLESIQSGKEIPLRMTPLIFVSTVVTQIFGGSAGREGAALQIGGSVGNFLGKLFKLNANDKKVFIMSGMSAAFSALFRRAQDTGLHPLPWPRFACRSLCHACGLQPQGYHNPLWIARAPGTSGLAPRHWPASLEAQHDALHSRWHSVLHGACPARLWLENRGKDFFLFKDIRCTC